MNDDERQGHARYQARLNAEAAVRHGETDAKAAAMTAIAWALLDVADAIREAAEYMKEENP